MGVFVQRAPWRAVSWRNHDVIDPDHQADVIRFPDIDLTMFLAANASAGKANSIHEKLIKAVTQVALDALRQNRADGFRPWLR